MHKLSHAGVGVSLIVISIEGGQELIRKLADIGLIVGHRLRVLNNSGYGSISIRVKGSKVALGHGLAAKVLVKEESKYEK